jgi:hypothetical protein
MTSAPALASSQVAAIGFSAIIARTSASTCCLSGTTMVCKKEQNFFLDSGKWILMREFLDSLAVSCPVCGAAPVQKCKINSGSPRFESHIERGWIAASGHIRKAAKPKDDVDSSPPLALGRFSRSVI